MTIEIEDFRFKTIIGLLDFERVNEQEVIVNLRASYDYSNGNYIDYVEICNLIRDTMQSEKFELLEDALLEIKSRIFKNFLVKDLYIKISKPNILKDTTVSLSENWERKS